jgi:putative transposase
MAKPYSEDLRERVIEAVEAGHNQTAVAAMFGISLRTVNGYVGLWRSTGSIAGKKFGGYFKARLTAYVDKVKSLVKAEPDATLAELQARLADEGITISIPALHRFLKAEKITYKKNAIRHGAKKNRHR